ncbi:MAG: phophatidylserine decarboxylase associated domain-containing protein, partial [Caldilineaceae bacterium]|nr:phophatidylserine decarboxylase associated domain-containing protein [Caldilineaceae bacterium]
MQPKTSRRNFVKLAGAAAGAVALHPAMAPGVASAAAIRPGAVKPGRVPPYRVGKWLPSDQAFLDRWLAKQLQAVRENPQPLQPVVQEFQDLIESDAELFMYFHQMFEELPRSAQFLTTPTGDPQVRDYKEMLALISAILTTAPEFNKTGLVGFPINAILDWPMGTEGGFAAFLNDKVNAQ